MRTQVFASGASSSCYEQTNKDSVYLGLNYCVFASNISDRQLKGEICSKQLNILLK